MTCNCEFKHRTTALTTAGVFTVTNPNNVGNFDPFCFIVTIDPDDVIVGAPVAATVTVNGIAVPLWDIWGYPITTDRLFQRSCYKGRYIIPSGGTTHITLKNICGVTQDPAAPATASITRSTSK